VPSSTATTRAATATDREGIVATFLGCWLVTYAATLPAPLVQAMTPVRAEALWRQILNEAAAGEVIVAESVTRTDGGIVGVTRWAVDADGPDAPHGAVHSLYVSPAAQGRGIGAMLLAAATGCLAATGVEVARLWVFRDNAPSIAFYRRSGWVPDGCTRVQAEFGEPEIRLAKELAG